MGRKQIISDGWRTCSRCLQRLEENQDNFYYAKDFKQWSGKCKPCHKEYARESARKNKYNNKKLAMLREAREKGDKMKKCPRCSDILPSKSFVPYDTNVYVNDALILKGHTHICGMCYYKLHDKVFSKIAGCIQYSAENGPRRTKKRKML